MRAGAAAPRAMLAPSFILQWHRCDAPAGVSRKAQRVAARLASRAALAQAIARWRALHGDAPWCDAPVEHDESGAPRFAHPGAPLLALAHAPGLGGAAIAPMGAAFVGIDAEPLDAPAARALAQLAQQTGESRLAWLDAHWPLRPWCAKEAAVKAERVPADLLGRTLRIVEVAAGEAGAQRVRVRTHRGRELEVETAIDGAHMTAWTV